MTAEGRDSPLRRQGCGEVGAGVDPAGEIPFVFETVRYLCCRSGPPLLNVSRGPVGPLPSASPRVCPQRQKTRSECPQGGSAMFTDPCHSTSAQTAVRRIALLGWVRRISDIELRQLHRTRRW